LAILADFKMVLLLFEVLPAELQSASVNLRRTPIAPVSSPRLRRDPTALWELALRVSGLFNLLLSYRLLFLPK
jgi:hypothetical protein